MKCDITIGENRFDPLIVPSFQAELCLSDFYEISLVLTTDTYDQFLSYSVLTSGVFQSPSNLPCSAYPDLRRAIESVFSPFLDVPENPIAGQILNQTASVADKLTCQFRSLLACVEALLFRYYCGIKTIRSQTAIRLEKHCQLAIRRWDGVHSLYKSRVPVYVFSALPPPLV